MVSVIVSRNPNVPGIWPKVWDMRDVERAETMVERCVKLWYGVKKFHEPKAFGMRS